MSEQHELARTVEACWRALREQVKGIALSAAVYPDPLWTVRDVMMHCAFWNDEATQAIEAHLDGGSCVTDTGAASFAEGLDAMNERVVEASRSVPEDEVRQRWVIAQNAFTEAVLSLDDHAMARPITCPWHERSSVPEMVQAELAHEQSHINDVLAAVSAEEGAQ